MIRSPDGMNELQHVQERRLSGAGTAGDDHVQVRLHAPLEHLEDRARTAAERDEVLRRDRNGSEPADRDRGSVEGEGRDDRVEAASVREAGVDHRARLVDAPADGGHDAVDDLHEVAVVDELDVHALEPALLLDVDDLAPVDQDVGDLRVAEQGLERSETEDVVEDLFDEALALEPVERHRARLDLLGQRVPEPFGELVARRVRHLLEVERLEELAVERLLDSLELGRVAGRCRAIPLLGAADAIDQARRHRALLIR